MLFVSSLRVIVLQIGRWCGVCGCSSGSGSSTNSLMFATNTYSFPPSRSVDGVLEDGWVQKLWFVDRWGWVGSTKVQLKEGRELSKLPRCQTSSIRRRFILSFLWNAWRARVALLQNAHEAIVSWILGSSVRTKEDLEGVNTGLWIGNCVDSAPRTISDDLFGNFLFASGTWKDSRKDIFTYFYDQLSRRGGRRWGERFKSSHRRGTGNARTSWRKKAWICLFTG